MSEPRAREAFDFFTSRGWSPAQAAAIVGHGIAESNLNPNAVGDSGAALGGWQWNDRRPNLIAFAGGEAQARDFRKQMEFVQHELETSEGYAASQLRAAKTVDQATAAFMHFERPSGYSRENPTGGHNWTGRLANAQRVYAGMASYPATGSGYVAPASVTATPSADKLTYQEPVQPRSVWTDVEVAQQRAQAQANPYGLAEGAWAATKDAQTLGWLMAGRTDLLPDPNWSPTREVLQAAQKGIPEAYHGQLGAAHSQAHLEQIRDRILQDVEHERRLDAMGWTGTALRVGTSFTDIPGLALTVLAPEVGLPARASMLARMGVRGLEGAAINTALEIPRVMNKPTAHGSDLLWAAGTGMALGGAFGALARNPAVAEEANALTRIGKSLQAHAEEELRAGTALGSSLDDAGMVMTVRPSSSAGAMQNSPRERLTANADDWLHSAVDDAIERSAFDSVRWDLAGKGKASDNAATRAFTSGTVVDVVGNKDRSRVARLTAEEVQKQLDTDFTMRAFKAHQEGLSDFMERNGIKPALKEDADLEFRRLVTDYIDNVRPEVEFDPAVKKVGDLQRRLYADYLEYAQNPGLIDGSVKRSVKGFDNLEKDPNYRPNIADHQKIDALSVRHGDDTIRYAIAEAFKAAAPELGDELAAKMAKGYWRRLREASAGMTDLDRVMRGSDMEALKKALGDLDLGEKEVAHVLSIVTPKPTEGGTISRAKKRSLYDNNFEVGLRDKATGEMVPFRMKDLFHDDYLYLFQSYSRSLSGQIGMAHVQVRNPLHHPVNNPEAPEYLIDGITGKSDLESLVRDMRAVWDGKTELPHDKRVAMADRDEKRMRFIYDRVTGVPDSFAHTTPGRLLKAVQDYNFVRVMNQVGLAQIGETLGVVTQLGFRAAYEGIPMYRAMIRDAKSGELTSAFAREMEELSGFGADWFRDGFRRKVDDAGVLLNTSAGNQRLNALEDVLHTGKRITNAISGMSAVDTFARRWASAAAVMKIVNAAAKTGDEGAVKGLNMNRMRALGVDDEMAHRVFAQIRKHADFEGGEVAGRNYLAGNFAKWDDQEALSAFRTAVWRWSRLVVQENHLGQTAPLLSHPMARLILQFRSFMLGAWTTQFLRQAHMRDWSGFSTWMMTSAVGGMVYTAQTYLNSMGRSDQRKYLDEKLSTRSIVGATVQRGSWSSIIPTMVDTGVTTAGFKPWFDTRATGQASNAFLGNPTVDLFNSTHRAIRGVGRAARDGGWSQGDIRAAARVLPFSNALGFVPLLNTMIQKQPERSGQH